MRGFSTIKNKQLKINRLLIFGGGGPFKKRYNDIILLDFQTK